MDKKDKTGIMELFSKSGSLKATLITCAAIIIAVLVWTNYSWSRMFDQFVRQGDSLAYIAGQTASIEKLKKCVNKEYNEAAIEFGKMINTIGKTLDKNSVPFPQSLNESINDFRAEFGGIKECLIFPEESS